MQRCVISAGAQSASRTQILAEWPLQSQILIVRRGSELQKQKSQHTSRPKRLRH